ncbi:phage portal protein [Blastococcus xanthinilyticus]|uniref:SPP1 Gp6-like portal protein n=1 Tax=Blastococcus xanthinilyticus TaxID=1564164 RepID=A0A5S5CPV7_9ACTN|nr:phage portal protein [Blastococcus xanthinilyticus]TYP82063.1 SPP1 Gp6-like portal protein [Blastococcus xanthinilyticus]
MALTDDESRTLRRLNARLAADRKGTQKRPGFDVLDRYYDGEQQLKQLGLAVPAELQEFITIVAWPGTYVDAIAERCVGQGFRLPEEQSADPELERVWQANDLDDEAPLAHTDALVFGRSYICVGTNPADEQTPLITVESPLEMAHEQSPATRATTAAARFYSDDSFGRRESRATLYLANSTVHVVRSRRGWEEATDEEFERDDHGAGMVMVEPMVNRARPHKRYGLSQMSRVISLTDAAARGLTLAQVATEVMGIPQRTAAGLTQADFKDPKTGEMLTEWEAYFGAVWATANKDAKFHQFTAADLQNFKTIVTTYAELVAGVTGLPLRYLGQLATNPPSADGIRADEARLVGQCESKTEGPFGAAWERTMRKVRRLQTGEDAPELAQLEMLWRDPATPTRAQAADAAVKLYQAGIISKRQARRDLGYSSVQISNMEQDDADAAMDPQMDRMLREVLTVPAPADAAA